METENNFLLKIQNLHTYFYTNEGIARAVEGVDLELEEGGTLGLVGESGCGKSITALSIMRLIQDPPGKITQGKIYFNGTNLLLLSEAEMRKIRGRSISMIFQEPMTSLNPVLQKYRNSGKSSLIIWWPVTFMARMNKSSTFQRGIRPRPRSAKRDGPH